MKDSELETQLRSLRPAEPSLTLEQRIATELAQPAPAPTAGIAHTTETGWAGWLFPRLAWAASGAVAAIVFTQATPRETAPPQVGGNDTASATPLVIKESSEVLDMNNEGLTVDAEHGIARIVRLTSIQRRSWVDTTGAEITTEQPREDLVLVPVTYQ